MSHEAAIEVLRARLRAMQFNAQEAETRRTRAELNLVNARDDQATFAEEIDRMRAAIAALGGDPDLNPAGDEE